MTKSDLKSVIKDCCNDVVFTYNGYKSGVTAEVTDSIPTFQVWHGEKIKEYVEVDELMNDKFFSGKSINEIVDSGFSSFEIL